VAIATIRLASGGIAFCIEYRGDWKWQRERFGLSSHWGAANFCHVCTAKGKGDHLSKCLGNWFSFLFVVYSGSEHFFGQYRTIKQVVFFLNFS